jgi:hypothetical protein
MSLIVKEHKDSLETIERRGQIVKVLGKGLMKSPGHPAGNQQYSSQLSFLNYLSKKPYVISIYKVDLKEKLTYLGEYRLLDMKIKESFEGFRYFEYTMSRMNYKTQGDEPSILQS